MTPRKYLSWSSMDLLERDEEKWKQLYLFGEQTRVNRGMAFGRQMADGLENDEATGDMTIDLIIGRLPKYEIMDKAVECELKLGRGENPIPILIKPDTMKSDMTAFKEYKTGQGNWSKKKVDEFGQITFYATGIYLKTGKIPTDIELVHVKTEKAGNEALEGNFARIQATGDIFRYHTQRNMSQILNMMVRMKKAWIRINDICDKELL